MCVEYVTCNEGGSLDFGFRKIGNKYPSAFPPIFRCQPGQPSAPLPLGQHRVIWYGAGTVIIRCGILSRTTAWVTARRSRWSLRPV